MCACISGMTGGFGPGSSVGSRGGCLLNAHGSIDEVEEEVGGAQLPGGGCREEGERERAKRSECDGRTPATPQAYE